MQSDLPFGSEFSPSQINLIQVLELCIKHEGKQKELEEDILNTYFSGHGNGNISNQKKLAMNCRLGLKSYGIIDENANLTDFGKSLVAVKENQEELYKSLARHILLNLNGMAFIQCIRDMTIAGEEVNLTTLRAKLAERGIHFPSGGKHPSIMRLWLAKADIFVGSRWQINEEKLQEVLGANPDEMNVLAKLTSTQRDFLLALANSGISSPQPANQIVKLAEATYGVTFPEKSLPKEVLNTLVDAGYITINKTTGGRGAKPFDVTPTDKLVAEIVVPLLEQLKKQTDPKLIELLRRPIKEIINELDSTDKYISGLALEALAFKLMRLLGMDYLATRLRAQTTGGAEVDLLFESARLVYSRWQIQCKNTARVALDDVAKEVGLTHFLKSNVIVIISTGKIGQEARRYSNKIMNDSNLCIVMVDDEDLEGIVQNPSYIVDVFNREAKLAMSLKKLEL
ncbi:MAG: restriction endonuclease [SAR324 cluster bacterium]|uniref:Restriction endonuclease n=1 Tax=SAR324 cluster bacterium TaxID=2024889 RepID=A0A7X9FUN3_9DELT|nr:restriction endonuclease [SAR324 cluster bacterium]